MNRQITNSAQVVLIIGDMFGVNAGISVAIGLGDGGHLLLCDAKIGHKIELV